MPSIRNSIDRLAARLRGRSHVTLRFAVHQRLAPMVKPLIERLLPFDDDGETYRCSISHWTLSERPVLHTHPRPHRSRHHALPCLARRAAERTRMSGGKAMTPAHSMAAFEALYGAEYARVLRFFRKRVGGDDAPDLAQEVFIKLLAAGVVEHIENPPAYLTRCARDLLINRARRRASAHIVTCPIDEGRDAPAPPEQTWKIEEGDVRRVYRRTLLAMPRKTRRIFLMHRLKCMTYAEISEQVGIGYDGVEYHMMRALARCRRTASVHRF